MSQNHSVTKSNRRNKSGKRVRQESKRIAQTVAKLKELAEAQRNAPEVFIHPRSGVLMPGRRVRTGEVLLIGDLYDSTEGNWQRCPCPGAILGITDTIWVRPAEI
jgi:hypothetical protein